MLLNLRRIRGAHERFDRVYQPADFAGREEEAFRVVAPATLGFDVHKDKDHFRLVGRVQTTLELPCSRCLEPFALPVDSAFDLRYQPQSANVGPGGPADSHEREIEEDDLTTAFYEGDQIDLGQLMREQFYLALPMKPLCTAECRGLCGICGTNLNRGDCLCDRRWEDPRFEALKRLQEDSHHKGHQGH